MSPPLVARPSNTDLCAIAELASKQQREADRHISYLPESAPEIHDELADLPDWTGHAAIVRWGGRLVAALVGDVDLDVGRVWWLGPFIDAPEWSQLATAMHEFAHRSLPSAVSSEEFASDVRHSKLAAWADSRGLRSGDASLTLSSLAPSPYPSISGIETLCPESVGPVAALHDALFPGTYLPGAKLLETRSDTHPRIILRDGEELLGYAVGNRQLDGRGYIDFVGVAESARRRGAGTRLLHALINRLVALDCPSIHLTVKASNKAARSLYARLGFEEGRAIRGYRRSW